MTFIRKSYASGKTSDSAPYNCDMLVVGSYVLFQKIFIFKVFPEKLVLNNWMRLMFEAP